MVVPHNALSPVSTAACLQIVVSIPNLPCCGVSQQRATGAVGGIWRHRRGK
ncbi:MAG: hypothetical protein ACR5LD_03915 [Symbiopectobacterium sp.]